ncbi:hypothetical protein PG911_04175 [Tenacibaculum ovolyticum]|uniref:hypothetical protein n=1 Tax=Tenacibaculum ovolyticum TaxID=104270 RepID=UPI0022F3F6A0|nr:hypothetical protein [Tenacibaculum ovolyticum]WBX77470.1 hypothetical protein PG911_04175 [Tenacibaculum ovolyticum]
MGILKNIIIAILLFLFCLGCKDSNRPVSFTYLDKLSGKTTSSYGDDGYIYIETILIDNPPKDKKRLREMEDTYFKENNKIRLLENDIILYGMCFYEKTSCTEYFIDNKEDSGGFSNSLITEDCAKDERSIYYYERDKENPNMWVSNLEKKLWGKEYHDTIYCKPNRKKLKLPDVPR